MLINERTTWCHLLFYFNYYALNMFRTLIYSSSGACDCVDELPHPSSCSQFVVCWSFCCGWYLVVFVLQAYVSDINISIFRSLRLCWWITTSVVLFLVRCVLELLLPLVFGGVRFAGCKTNTTKYQPQQKLQHTTNWEQDDWCGNSSTQSQAPEDEYINVRNMLST